MKKRKFVIKCHYFNRYNLVFVFILAVNTLAKLKKINCFIYIVLAKYCWVIKLGEFKSDQKYFGW